MKRLLFILVVCMLCLTGCSEASVRLDNEAALRSYAKSMYGSAELIRSLSDDDSLTCYFRDEEYGFEYYIKSYKASVNVDGAIFGYHEAKASNFLEKYAQFLWDKIKNSSQHSNIAIIPEPSFVVGGNICGYIEVASDGDTQTGVDVVKDIGARLLALDTRGRLQESLLVLRGPDNTEIGHFDFAQKVYLSEQEARVAWYRDKAQEILGSKDVEMGAIQTIAREDVPGLAAEEIVRVLGQDIDTVTLYYFKHRSKEYFIADISVLRNNYPCPYVYCIHEGRPVVSSPSS
jgi:hypothetical protein